MKIFLLGFMGSGKTHWGRIWSAAYQFSFVDLDHVIEKEKGKTIAKIFEEHGEDYFRKLETETLHSFHEHQNAIISCGGGTPCFNNNMQWMNEYGVTVYLKSTPKQLAMRLNNEQHKRPLLQNVDEHQLEDFIKEKLLQREPFYSEAQIILEAEEITKETFQRLLSTIYPDYA
jgi:shikimate kinase